MTQIQHTETREIYSIELQKGAGEEYKPCPVCSESRRKSRKPSFSWNHDKGAGKCHHCGASFTAPTEKPYSESEKQEPLPPLNNTQLSDKTLSYFRQRGIGTTTVKRNGITEAKHFMPQAGRERNCICFNYFVRGQHVNTKFRDGEKNFTQVKGADKYFYGLDDVQDAESIIIVEGEFDKLAFEEAGYKNCISVPDGALQPNQTYSNDKLRFIENSYDYLKHAERFYLATDTDPPGQSLREELARRLGMYRSYLVDFRDYKDANDALIKGGPDYLAGCIQEARLYPIKGVKTFEDVRDGIFELYENGIQTAVQTGLPTLDKHANFGQGWLTVLTGIPSHGKSSFMDQVMVLLAQKGYRFGVFSPEHDIRLHFQRLARILMGKQFFGGEEQMTRQDLDFAIKFLSDHIFSIRPDVQEKSLDKVLEVGKETIGRYGVHFLLIDPWGSLQHTYENEHRFVKEALGKLNDFKIEYNAHICVVAHPKKMHKKGPDYEIPTAYDIAESSHFYNQSDQVLTIYYNHEEELTELHIQKVKFQGILGETGIVSFSHDKKTNRFTETGTGVNPGGAVPKPDSPAEPPEMGAKDDTSGGEPPF